MVGRLVQKQDIRITEEGFCQQDLDFDITLKITHGSIVIFCVNAQAVQQHGSIGFCLPAVHLRKLSLQLAGTDAVFIREILFCIDGILFLHDLIEAFITHNDGIHYNAVIVLKVILLQNGEALAGRNGDITLCCLQAAGQNL